MCLSIRVSDGTLGTFFAATLGLSVLQWHGVLASGGALGLWQAALWNNVPLYSGFRKDVRHFFCRDSGFVCPSVAWCFGVGRCSGALVSSPLEQCSSLFGFQKGNNVSVY